MAKLNMSEGRMCDLISLTDQFVFLLPFSLLDSEPYILLDGGYKVMVPL